tara:strand:+ start:118 stop:351 length:234 start_codon:yes stop_codon:yes gene_type:complete
MVSKHSYNPHTRKIFNQDRIDSHSFDNKSVGGQPSNILDRNFYEYGQSAVPSISGISEGGGINDYKSQMSVKDLTEL